TSTLSAPQRPSSPAPPATPGGPSSTACTSAPTASAIVRAAPTTSFDTLRSAPSRCSTTARIFAIVSPTEPWLLRAADGRAPALHPRPHRRHLLPALTELRRLLLERLLLSRHDSLERRITRLVLALRDREHGRER